MAGKLPVSLVLEGVILLNEPGQAFFVNSADGVDTATGLDWRNAFATIDYAIGQCSANAVIHVAPGHAENLSAASVIDMDVAGVHLLGYRRGRQMPTLTVTAVGGSMELAADNCTVEGFRFLGGIDAITGCITWTGDDVSLLDCEFRDVTGQATDVIKITGAARPLIDGFRFYGATADGGDSAIALANCANPVIRNCEFIGNWDVGAIDFRTTLSTDVRIHDIVVKTYAAQDICIVDTIGNSTGIIGPNVFMQLLDDAANLITAITGATFTLVGDVLVVNAAGEKAVAIPWDPSVNE